MLSVFCSDTLTFFTYILINDTIVKLLNSNYGEFIGNKMVIYPIIESIVRK